MADRKYSVDIEVQGADKAAAGAGKVNSALMGIGQSAKVAGAALFASAGVIAGMQRVATLAQEASRVERMTVAFEGLATRSRLTGDALGKMREATKGTISQMELMRSANNALLLGVAKSSDDLAELALIGRRLGAAMGIDAKQGIESLVIGIGRQSRLWLDNLGILVDVDKANRDYAAALGKTADKLTDAERKQAFFNETMAKARDLMKGLGEDLPSTPIERLDANLKNLTNTWGQGAAVLSNVYLKTLDSFWSGIDDGRLKLTGFGAALLSGFTAPYTIVKAFNEEIDALNKKDSGFVDRLLANIRLAQQATDAQAAKEAEEAEKARLAAEVAAQKKRQEMWGHEFEAIQTRVALKREEAAFTEGMLQGETAWQDEAIDGLEDYTEGLFLTADALGYLDGVEDRVAKMQAARARQKHALTMQGLSDLAAANQAFRGSAEVTKRIMQVQATIEASKAFTGTLATASGLFPPPIPQILAGAALAAGLAQVAVIEQQSFARGGVIEGAGGPTQDNIPVRASAGESILTAQATARLGRDGVDALNNGGGAGVTVVIQGNLIGTESFVRDTLIPQIDRTLRKRLA